MTKAGPMGSRPDDPSGSGTSLAKPQHGQDGVWRWKFNQTSLNMFGFEYMILSQSSNYVSSSSESSSCISQYIV